MRVSTWGFFTVEPSVELQFFSVPCCRAFTFATSICSLDLSVSSTFGWKSYGWPIGDDGHHLESHEKIPSINKYTVFLLFFYGTGDFKVPHHQADISCTSQDNSSTKFPPRLKGPCTFCKRPLLAVLFSWSSRFFSSKLSLPANRSFSVWCCGGLYPKIEKPQFHGILGWWDI